MIVLQGKGVSSGIAVGELVFWHRTDRVIVRKEAQETGEELARWREAQRAACEQLASIHKKTLAELGAGTAALFDAHRMILEDRVYEEKVTRFIMQEHDNAEYAVQKTGRELAQMFAELDDDDMRARSADVLDVSTRVIRILRGEGNAVLPEGKKVIVAADDLTPSETIQMDKSRILGFILSGGNANSHTAILSKTLGIPAVIRADGIENADYEGREIMMDGDTGRIVIEPDAGEKKMLSLKIAEQKKVRSGLERLIGKEDVTKDNKAVKLYANIGSLADVDAVIANDARGIGLFRSEFLYLEHAQLPDEEKQFAAYRTVLERMKDKQVVIRTLDIGADKQPSYMQLKKEENPALGMRALRICLTRPELLFTQLRALYRASVYGRLSVMIPLVTSIWEIREVKRICEEIKSGLDREHIPYDPNVRLGVMIETPAAVMIAPELAREVDFFSVGTNDLTQYALALDRQGNADLERFYDGRHPAVLRMIEMSAAAAHEVGIPIAICGELASDLELTEQFLRMGIDGLSVPPRAVLPLRAAIRGAQSKKNGDK